MSVSKHAVENAIHMQEAMKHLKKVVVKDIEKEFRQDVKDVIEVLGDITDIISGEPEEDTETP